MSFRSSSTTAPAIPVPKRSTSPLILKRAVGPDAVFLDHERLEAGKPWPDELRAAVSRSKIMIALVGRRWAIARRGRVGRRLENSGNWVRQEIEAAFGADLIVVPVLVDRVKMPRTATFSSMPRLAPLAKLQALQLRRRDWDADVAIIVDLLCKHGFERVSSSAGTDRGPVQSTIPARGDAPFVGRNREIDELFGVLANRLRQRFVVLQGSSGVGKSELAFEFARRAADRYPGGTFQIDMSSSGPPPDLALVGRNVLHLQFAQDLSVEDQCRQALHKLAAQPCLLVLDDVGDPKHADDWLPPAGARCHVIATSIAQAWTDRWKRLDLKPLDDKEARLLAQECGGKPVDRGIIETIVQQAGGLPGTDHRRCAGDPASPRPRPWGHPLARHLGDHGSELRSPLADS